MAVFSFVDGASDLCPESDLPTLPGEDFDPADRDDAGCSACDLCLGARKDPHGVRGMSVFVVSCLGVGSVCESLSLRTGFPFGHYYFTGLMGPKLFQVPILLILAYLGIGYCSWVLALLILGYRSRPFARSGVISVPLLAGVTMLAWDFSMEAIWSTVDRAWIWRDGGLVLRCSRSATFSDGI